MKKINILPLLFLLLFFSACKDDSGGHVPPGELIRGITSKIQADNALRMDINIEFKDHVEYQIEYWQSESPENTRTTLKKKGDGKTKTTLILLEAQTNYHFRILAESGNKYTESEVYSFKTDFLPSGVPTYTLQQDDLNQQLPGYIMQTRGDKLPGYITILDMKGNVVWYENTKAGTKVATFDPATNTICCILGSDPEQMFSGKEILILDLFGNILLHKNYEQLGKRYFHHDIRRLPDGNVVFVNYVPKQFDLTAQGGKSQETVFGDGLTVMDVNGNFKWTWDCFSEIDPRQDPDIMKKIYDYVELRDDWIHVNSVNYDKDGSFYISSNWLNEIWKINPKTGKVVYRLGGKGSDIPFPKGGYTQGLHSLKLLDNNKILLFENGMQTHSSRALIFTVDENSKTATLNLNVALPQEYSSLYMSGVELIDNKLLMFGSAVAQAVIFTDLQGNILRIIKGMHQSFRADYIPEINY